MTTQSSSPWEFRTRTWIAFVIYFFGFFAGYAIDHALGGHGTPTYLLVGLHWGDSGVRAAAALAGFVTAAGFFIRWWGSSYHNAGVVFSGRIETGSLTANGPYRYVRNPLYLGNLLQSVGISSLGPPATMAIILILLTAFLYRLIFLEEVSLRRAFGDPYTRYCEAVPRLLPRLWPANLPHTEERPHIFQGFITELGTFGFAVWMGYVGVVNPPGPTPVFYNLFYIAILLFMIGGILNRRMSNAARGRKDSP
jgi:protein-S-isoprenylcysteine O-methyltransferase Ste14